MQFTKHAREGPPWLWNPGQTLPEVRNRGISGPTKMFHIFQNLLRKEQKVTSGSTVKNSIFCLLYTDGTPSTKRHSCFNNFYPFYDSRATFCSFNMISIYYSTNVIEENARKRDQ